MISMKCINILCQLINAYRQISVLNIYGDLEDGTESDGIIMTEDARALRDIVAHKVASYDEVEITGLGGQHTLLHENGEVDETVSLFLWGQ